MASTIDWNLIDWSESDAFVHFAFGEFDSKAYGIVRTSNGNRYQDNLSPQLEDKVEKIDGGDGTHFFGTQHRQKNFSVAFAFDNLSKEDIQALKRTFSGKELKELCFAESADRVYIAKVVSEPNIKSLCFNVNGVDVYRGEGTIQFTAYWPYARDIYETTYNNQDLYYDGDAPAYFTVMFDNDKECSKETEIQVGNTKITLLEKAKGLQWDSKTGMVSRYDEQKDQRKPAKYSGKSIGVIPVDGISKSNIVLNGGTLTYYQWYY